MSNLTSLSCTHSRKQIKQFRLKLGSVVNINLPEKALLLSVSMLDDMFILSVLVPEVEDKEKLELRSFYIALDERRQEWLPEEFNREWDYRFIDSITVQGQWGNYCNPIFYVFEIGPYLLLQERD